MSDKFLKIGHRGACGYEPENTLGSFQKAIDLGAEMIEFDVHLCKSGEAVVIHDETVNRTSNGHGYVNNMELAELKKLNLGKDEKIPTLQEVIDKFKGKIKFNIEVKGVKPAQEVCRLISENKIESEVIVSSNHVESLLAIKKNLPSVETALIYYATKTVFRQYIFVLFAIVILPLIKMIILWKAKNTKADAVHLVYPFATKKFVAKLHQLGYKVGVWVVNSEKIINKMKAIGADRLISNFPDRLK